MSRRARLGLGLPLVLALLTAGVVLTAANVVADSRAGIEQDAVTANDLKPPECATLNLAVVRGPGGGGGGNANALIIGTAAGESINGNGGDDCILGGGGNDTLRGNGGNDVCVGGAGTDSFHRSCEVSIQ